MVKESHYINDLHAQEHDSYSGFRSQKLDLEFQLDVLPSKEEVRVQCWIAPPPAHSYSNCAWLVRPCKREHMFLPWVSVEADWVLPRMSWIVANIKVWTLVRIIIVKVYLMYNLRVSSRKKIWGGELQALPLSLTLSPSLPPSFPLFLPSFLGGKLGSLGGKLPPAPHPLE